MNKILKNLIR